jgi:hypothetical protein
MQLYFILTRILDSQPRFQAFLKRDTCRRAGPSSPTRQEFRSTHRWCRGLRFACAMSVAASTWALTSQAATGRSACAFCCSAAIAPSLPSPRRGGCAPCRPPCGFGLSRRLSTPSSGRRDRSSAPAHSPCSDAACGPRLDRTPRLIRGCDSCIAAPPAHQFRYTVELQTSRAAQTANSRSMSAPGAGLMHASGSGKL